jgi:hypothetical protein
MKKDLDNSNNSRNIAFMGTVYNEVKTIIDGMDIGDAEIIAIPGNLSAFRKYLSEISKRESKKFTTKLLNGKLHILRVKYSNIYSKELE